MPSCTDILICPVCGAGLSDVDRSLRCPQRHTFDRAREGYVHLLPAGHGRSARTGDAREMLQARRRFLDAGWYAPLADAVSARALAHLAGHTGAPHSGTARPAAVLDAGCGEGYYLGRLAEHARSTNIDACFLGVDIATDAVRLAARRYRGIGFYVSDVKHRLCVADASIDVLLNIFAPRNAAEFARVLRPDGLLLVVVPEQEHLAELRALLPLLDVEPDKRDRTIERLEPELELAGEESLAWSLALPHDAVADLVRMTPSYRHTGEAPLADVAARGPVTTSLCVRLLTLHRRTH